MPVLLGYTQLPQATCNTRNKKEKVTPPGTCHAHRGQSRKAHMEYHRGLCLSPVQGNPSPAESRRAHMAYLEREKQKQLPLGTAPRKVFETMVMQSLHEWIWKGIC